MNGHSTHQPASKTSHKSKAPASLRPKPGQLRPKAPAPAQRAALDARPVQNHNKPPPKLSEVELPPPPGPRAVKSQNRPQTTPFKAAASAAVVGETSNQTYAAARSVRVFVSSTFADMKAEREHLVSVVFPEVRARCVTDLRFYSHSVTCAPNGSLAVPRGTLTLVSSTCAGASPTK